VDVVSRALGGAGVAAMMAPIAIVIAAALARADDARGGGGDGDGDGDRAASLAAWDDIYRVLQHPRCRNCHPAGDAPLQRDDGIRHAQNVTRRSVKNGLLCAECHRARNSTVANGPPGAPGWNLPPEATPMVFEGRSSAALCVQLKDPEQNGHRDLHGLVEHVDEPLVKWGWDPGEGRTVPPISHAEISAAVRRWLDTGAACP
jgi:hypothetical protein